MSVEERTGDVSNGITFRPSEEFAPYIQPLFDNLREQILAVAPHTEVLHVGGSSIPGAYTKGDLDIQVRVSDSDLPQVVVSLGLIFDEDNKEKWNNDLAIFTGKSNQWKVDVMVTRAGSVEDNCHLVRDFLLIHPDFLAEYNSIKLMYENGDHKEYKRVKDKFYKRVKELIKCQENHV